MTHTVGEKNDERGGGAHEEARKGEGSAPGTPWFKRLRRRNKRHDALPDDAGLLKDGLIRDLIEERRRERNSRRLFRIAMVLLVAAPALLLTLARTGSLPHFTREYVARIDIEGPIGFEQGVEAEPVIKALKKAFEADRARAVMLYVDSPGGAPAVAARIGDSIARLKQKYDKPVEVVIDGTGASAAYLIALFGDRITANRYALVGAIGAIMTAWNLEGLMRKVDVEHYAYASGRLKDMLSPYRGPTAEEQQKAEALVEEVGGVFYDEVERHRGDRLAASREEVSSGEVWTADRALAMGLIDEIGTVEDIAARYDNITVLKVGPARSPFATGFAGLANGVVAWLSRWQGRTSGRLQMIAPQAL